MKMLAKSRFNPKPGLADFWNEFRKPNPYRWPILLSAALPVAGIIWWFSGEEYYKAPERPQITYITTLDENRTDEEIMASNIESQELEDLRNAEEERLEQRKRDLYKVLGAAAGMDVDRIAREADEERAAREAERKKELEETYSVRGEGEESEAASSEGGSP